MGRPRKQQPAPAVVEKSTAADETALAVAVADVDANVTAENSMPVDSPEPAPVVAASENGQQVFPRSVTIKNNTPSSAKFPLLKAVIERHSEGVFAVIDEKQLARLKSNAKQLNQLWGYDAIEVIEG